MQITNEHELDRPLPAGRCYRLHWLYLFVGVAGGLCFIILGILSTIAAAWNIDGSFRNPKLAAWFFAVFWSAWTLYSAGVIAIYFRSWLLVTDSGLVHQGTFRSKRIEFDDVHSASWRSQPMGGRIVIRTHFDKATILFGNFARDDREEVIQRLREAIVIECQENWSLFQEAILGVPAASKSTSNSNSQFTWAAWIGFACVFFYVWHIGFGIKYLVACILNAIVSI